MKRFPMLFVAALLGAAVSVPAQFRDRGNAGRSTRGNVVAAHQNRAPQTGQRAVRSERQSRRVGAVRSTPVRHNGEFRQRGRRGGAVDNRRGSVRFDPDLRGNRRYDRSRRVGHGHWVTRCERVLVPGYWDERHLPAIYGWVYDNCGHRHWGIVTPARCERVWIPARWELQERRVWVRC